MNVARGNVNIREWTRDAGIEPSLRVGIILDQDAMNAVHLRLPDQHYTIEGSVKKGTGAEPSEVPAPFVTKPHTTLHIRHAKNALMVGIDDNPAITLKSLRLSRTAPTHQLDTAKPNEGVLVHDVPTGRGFHWQKIIDQTLTGTIELLPGNRGVVLVNVLPLEDYLAGVITAEMSGTCPVDLLKAQCIVARSWLLAMSESKHDADPFDRCNDDCCQRYQGTADLNDTAIDAVRSTRGLVLLDPADNVLDANYAKCCGGISETPRAVWGMDKPGLTSIIDAPTDADERRFFPITEKNLDEYLDGDWLRTTRIYCSPNVVPASAIERYLGRVDEADDYFRWTVHYQRDELEMLLRQKLAEARQLATLRNLRVTARGVSGRARAVDLEWEDAGGKIVRARLDSEYRIRQVLHRKFLYSSAIVFHVKRDCHGQLTAVTLHGAGWGHGVGMCQIGALGMTLSGIDFKHICKHYYPESRLANVYQ